jgi:microcompartment protein CcmL/EutN
MIGGPLADVEAAMRVGVETAGDTVLDHFTIQRVHEQLPAAIKGIVKVEGKEALGLIETKEVASAIYAADAAVKAAAVWLIEARNQAGGKGLVVLAGDVGAVRAAVAAGVSTIKKDGMLIADVVIPFAHRELLKGLTG